MWLPLRRRLGGERSTVTCVRRPTEHLLIVRDAKSKTSAAHFASRSDLQTEMTLRATDFRRSPPRKLPQGTWHRSTLGTTIASDRFVCGADLAYGKVPVRVCSWPYQSECASKKGNLKVVQETRLGTCSQREPEVSLGVFELLEVLVALSTRFPSSPGAAFASSKCALHVDSNAGCELARF